jgi:hypothetical protein
MPHIRLTTWPQSPQQPSTRTEFLIARLSPSHNSEGLIAKTFHSLDMIERKKKEILQRFYLPHATDGFTSSNGNFITRLIMEHTFFFTGAVDGGINVFFFSIYSN